MTIPEKEKLIEEKKISLRTQSRQLDYGLKISADFSHSAGVFLKEQEGRTLPKEESAAKLLERLRSLSEAAEKLSADFDGLSRVKLKEADSLTIADINE